ncbi:MAG: heparinase II/III-family protein, partial [Bacteroidota bacterium]
AAIVSNKSIAAHYPYQTIESGDGVNGNEGGVSILRNGSNENLTSLLFKYTSQGMGHGHFDKLNYNLFDKGNEVLQDYGSARFIGVEQKYGGRYLPENKTYAAQTIAHNTIVVDEQSHFNGKEELGEKFHSQKLFSDVTNELALTVTAKEDNAYKNVHLQRSLYLLQLPEDRKILVDIFHANSPDDHQYDLPFQYNGQVINASFKYTAETKKQEALGTKNGYQFLWKEAEAKVADTTIQFTFLNSNTYYTISSLIQKDATLFFTRAGANDPNFNLRREPSFIIRKNAKDAVFINAIEIHGNHDPVNEFSTAAHPSITQINLLQNNAEQTVIEMMVAGKKLIVAQSNNNFSVDAKHTFNNQNSNYNWTGPYVVLYDGQRIKKPTK